MGDYVAMEVNRPMIKKDIRVKGAKVLVLGVTFKENCPYIRNSKVEDIINTLESFETSITILDSYANPEEVNRNIGKASIQSINNYENEFDSIILAVAHHSFFQLDISLIKKTNSVIYDVKRVLPKNNIDASL